MNCVYTAICDHLIFLGLPILPETSLVYDLVRQESGHNENDKTSGVVVPAIGLMIAALYDLDTIIEQDDWFDFASQATQKEQKFVNRLNIKSISQGPGIYCCYFSQHAMFAVCKPQNDVCMMSIKFRRY